MSRVRRFNGRPRQLITGADATNLYRRAHRVKVVVFVAGKPFVPLIPEMPTTTKQLMLLTNFVRYKALARRLPTEATHVLGRLESCEVWRLGTECEGGHDPRCLPFHVFETQHAGLDGAQQRRAFDDSHGPGGRRLDDQGLNWRLDPKGFHGREQLHVAGYRLQPGFHWDVSVDRSPKTVTTGTDRWRVFRYINIAPDAHFPRAEALCAADQARPWMMLRLKASK